jgi:feruloyl esterase
MWAPSTAVNGGMLGELFTDTRYRGQEGAADDAPVFEVLGTLGVIGFYLQDVNGDPLNFTLEEHGARQELIAPWMDATQPDLSDYADAGGKLIVIVGTDDIIASSGEQLNYYQTVLDAMGPEILETFARLYVLPQTNHILAGNSAEIDGEGNTIEPVAIPASIDRMGLLTRWVEEGIAPQIHETVTGQTGSRPMCSFPAYPHYNGGDPSQAASYSCELPDYY